MTAEEKTYGRFHSLTDWGHLHSARGRNDVDDRPYGLGGMMNGYSGYGGYRGMDGMEV